MPIGKKFKFNSHAGCNPCPSDTPLVGEFNILNAVSPPGTFFNDVIRFMKLHGVNRKPELTHYMGRQPAIFALKDPLCYTRRGQRIVVSKVWNSKIYRFTS